MLYSREKNYFVGQDLVERRGEFSVDLNFQAAQLVLLSKDNLL